MRRLVAVTVVVLVSLGALSGVATAKAKCGQVPQRIVEGIQGDSGISLQVPRQVKIPSKDHEVVNAWFVAAQIWNGPVPDGTVGVWARLRLRPGASGLLKALNDAALAATPDLGADLDISAAVNLESSAFDRAVQCVAS